MNLLRLLSVLNNDVVKIAAMENANNIQNEKLKEALIKAWEEFHPQYGNNEEIIECLENTIYKLNYRMLDLLSKTSENLWPDLELCTIYFDLHLIHEFLESVKKSLRE